MNTNFSEQLWIDFDLEVEYFLRFLVTWITHNSQKDKPELRNCQDGLYWSYNSYPEYSRMLPGFSVRTIRSIVARCVKNDLLKVGSFNRKKYDNTNWYTLTEKGWSYFEKEARKVYPERFAQTGRPDEYLNTPVNSDRPSVNSDRPIPKDLNSLGNINITISDIVETYHQELPELPVVKKVDTKLNAQLKKMVKDWPSYQKDGKVFSIESFRDYLQYLKKHYSWFLKPYPTESGNLVKSSLRKITRELNITRIVNGEFSAS